MYLYYILQFLQALTSFNKFYLFYKVPDQDPAPGRPRNPQRSLGFQKANGQSRWLAPTSNVCHKYVTNEMLPFDVQVAELQNRSDRASLFPPSPPGSALPRRGPLRHNLGWTAMIEDNLAWVVRFKRKMEGGAIAFGIARDVPTFMLWGNAEVDEWITKQATEDDWATLKRGAPGHLWCARSLTPLRERAARAADRARAAPQLAPAEGGDDEQMAALLVGSGRGISSFHHSDKPTFTHPFRAAYSPVQRMSIPAPSAR